jgi:hypothetical protein
MGTTFAGFPLFGNQAPVPEADTANRAPGKKSGLLAKVNS